MKLLILVMVLLVGCSKHPNGEQQKEAINTWCNQHEGVETMTFGGMKGLILNCNNGVQVTKYYYTDNTED